MADEEENTEAGEGEAKKGGMMKVILLVNGVLLLIGIGVGVFMFMGGEDEAPADASDMEVLEDAEDVSSSKSKKRGTPIYVPLHPAFVVNFENQEQVAFLQVDIQIMTYDSSVESALKSHMPAIRNELLLLLGGKQYHEINTREGKRALSQEAIQVMQDVLKDVGEASSIEALYFTSFVMQ
ncbi:MAG: flagellar basal body protein FliL [endosymbiont of Galathealinum brachiosum]|uniref:Flagellar protein FliL n=1 Tax=endosymbiont of Galathealinum brachiosum TaxID=2200906 RepID=A0A370DJS5_9GAMM|nr:MAG: flagellar basal body protein FliL [endosymbiont of Galathealinum brachiosum]